jgi:phosphate transport system substrate-binding protein
VKLSRSAHFDRPTGTVGWSTNSSIGGDCLARLRRLVVAVVALMPIAVIVAAPAAVGSPVLQTGGASFVEPAMQEWTSQASELLGLNVNFQVSSSVLGLNDFAQNELDFAESDIPYKSGQAQEEPSQPYQYLPDVAGAVSFMYNLTGKDGQRITNLVLNPVTVGDIFTGKIVYWDDPSINNSQLNPALVGDLPHTKIIPVYRADASGENYLLSDYLLHQDNAPFTAYQRAVGAPVGNPTAIWPIPQGNSAPPGYPNWATNTPIGENGSDAAANYVAAAANNGSITDVESAFAIEHHTPMASIVNASGNAIQPNARNDAVALERAILYSDLSENLTNVYTNPLPDAYPLSSYSYFVTPCSPQLASHQSPATSCAANNSASSSFSPAKGAALGQFVNFIACTGQQKMAQLGYSPLPPNLVAEDFIAIGRLNGGHEPPPPTASNCKNPYVDGALPLPGAPVIEGGAGTAAGAVATTVPSSASASGSPGASGPSGPAARAAGTSAASTKVSLEAAARARALRDVPNKFVRADALDAAATHLGPLSGPAIVLWVLVLLAVVLVPPVWWWTRRRTAPAGAGASSDGSPPSPPPPLVAGSRSSTGGS